MSLDLLEVFKGEAGDGRACDDGDGAHPGPQIRCDPVRLAHLVVAHAREVHLERRELRSADRVDLEGTQRVARGDRIEGSPSGRMQCRLGRGHAAGRRLKGCVVLADEGGLEQDERPFDHLREQLGRLLDLED